MPNIKPSTPSSPTPTSDVLLAQFFYLFPDTMFIIDSEGRVVDCNNSALSLFGYSKEEMQGLEPFLLFSEDTRRKLPELLKEINTTESITKKLEFIKENGELFSAEALLNRFETNGIVYTCLFIRNVTVEYEGDYKREFAGSEFTEITDILPEITNEPEMLVEMDTDGRITFASKVVFEKTGYTQKDLAGDLSIFRLFGEEYGDSLRNDISYILKGGIIEGTEYSIRGKSGSTFPIIASITGIVVDGVTKGLRAMALDVTEHKNAERDLLILEKLRSMGELAGGVVHDFNNILAIILGHTQLHSRECNQKRCKEIMEQIHRTTLDGIELIKRINSFTQITKEKDSEESVNLNDIVSEIVDLLKPKLYNQTGGSGKIITVEQDLSPLPLIQAGAAELREVMSNFFLNAIDAIQYRGTITIVTRSGGEYVSIDITDDGIGMSNEVKNRIFEPFFTTKQERGTGMGMSVSYGIINRLGGDVTVESEEGVGTTVSIVLPASPDADVIDHDCKTTTSLAILVVDDEVNICEILSEFLSAEGHDIVTADNGDTGLKHFGERDFDVLITDLKMPGMSGWELAKAVKQRSPGTVIIMLSGWGTEIDERNRKENAVDIILQKPINFSVLSSHIQKLDIK